MAGTKYLIVNADDFGQSPGINRGIITSHVAGIVTTASLMVRWPAAIEAASLAFAHPNLGLGLHLDLGEWAVRDGEWIPVYEVVPPDDGEAIVAAVEGQLDRFRKLVGRDPSHLDSHQHVHMREPVLTAARTVARRLGIPLRHDTPGVTYCGAFYGQSRDGLSNPRAISVNHLIEILSSLTEGLTELACHPGFDDDVESMYRSERAEEVKTLCHPDLRQTLQSAAIELVTFGRENRCRHARQ